MKPDPGAVFSQLARLQEQLQARLRELEVEASAGGGMVTASCNGYGELTRLSIEPDVVNRDEVELLEDLIRAAVNEARSRAREQVQQELRQMFGNLPIPPGLFDNLPV